MRRRLILTTQILAITGIFAIGSLAQNTNQRQRSPLARLQKAQN